MTSVRDTPRTIIVGERAEYHRNYESLQTRSEALLEVIVELDARYPPGTLDYLKAAKDVSALAADLREILDAMFAWMADIDREILDDIEKFRRDLRNLKESFATDNDEENMH